MHTMKSLPEPLPNDTAVLHKMVQDYQLTVEQLQEKLNWYEEKFRLFQHRRFGTSSEIKWTPLSRQLNEPYIQLISAIANKRKKEGQLI